MATETVHGLAPVDLLERFESEYGADLFGFTITRIRGHVKVLYDAVSPARRNEFSWGIRVATEQSFAEVTDSAERAGVIPLADPHADWMLTHADMNQITDTGEWKEYRWDVDFKAQRRMDELGQGLYFIAGWLAFSNPPLLQGVRDVSLDLNVLCKRP